MRRLAIAGILLPALIVGMGVTVNPRTASADERFRPFEVGVFGGYYKFTDKHGLGRFENDPAELSPKSSFELGLRFGYLFIPHLGFEAEVMLVPTKTGSRSTAPVITSTNELIFGFRAHLMFQILSSGAFRPFIVVGWEGLASSPSDKKIVPSDTDDLLYAGIGAKFFITPSILLRLDGRIADPPTFLGGGSGDETGKTDPDFEVLLGLSLAFGGKEAAPPPPPPPEGPKDTDGDGIMDPDDKCPNDPEDKDGFQDADGCPDPDNDNDGIPDKSDKCPNDPEDKDGFQDEDGCPDPDNDNDGIPDTSDKCPNEPETKNNYQDEDGCPDTIPVQVQKFTGIIQGINFKFNSDVITKNSYPILDKAAQVLKDYPDVKLEIQGHTDNKGGADYNKDLSQRRANSVRAYFVGKGIDESRLTAVGYGLEMPIADNKTEKGRAKNRRVEFKLK
jgi:OmpA-OmpF porin, OOP family